MIDQATVDLINKEIDGVILPEEADTLRELVASDPSVQRLYDELQATTRVLAAVKEVESPAGLKASIMRTIERPRAAQRSAVSIVWSFLKEARQALTLSTTYAFSGGLIAGAVVVLLFFTVFNAPTLDTSNVAGTMIVTGEKVDLHLDKVQGVISTERSDGLRSLDLHLVAQDKVEARISFDTEAVRIEGVKRLDSSVTDLNVRGGEIDFQGQGKFGYRFSFTATSRTSPQVMVSLFSSGRLVYQKEIALD